MAQPTLWTPQGISEGSITVNCTVSNDRNLTTSASTSVTVSAPPPASSSATTVECERLWFHRVQARREAPDPRGYQIQRVTDLYVTPSGEDLGKIAGEVERIVSHTKLPPDVRVDLRGMVQGMYASFRSFALARLFPLSCYT